MTEHGFSIRDDGSLGALSIFVVDQGTATPLGRLNTVGRRARSSVLEFDDSWRTGPGFAPSPTVKVSKRAIDSLPYAIPLFLYDSLPDGWGRHVLQSAYPGHRFSMLDYLAAAGPDRSGILDTGATFSSGPVPWRPSSDVSYETGETEASIERLLEASTQLQEGKASPQHFRLLLRGSPALGGARPKAAFMTSEGRHVILKFPVHDDAIDEQKAEAVCLQLAKYAGIDAPDFSLIPIENQSVLQVDRFDRTSEGHRKAVTSACVLMGANPDAYTAPSANYADICERARRLGVEDPGEEVFRRMVFNAVIHNTDDHLFNHAFLRNAKTGKWKLSPVFDILPHAPKQHVIAATRSGDRSTDPVRKIETYEAFGLSREKASEIYADIRASLSRLPQVFDAYEVHPRDRQTISEMMPAAIDPPKCPL